MTCLGLRRWRVVNDQCSGCAYSSVEPLSTKPRVRVDVLSPGRDVRPGTLIAWRGIGQRLSPSAGADGSVAFSHRLPRLDGRDLEIDVDSAARQIARRDSWIERNRCLDKSDAIGETHSMACDLRSDKGGDSRQDVAMLTISKLECTHPYLGHFRRRAHSR